MAISLNTLMIWPASSLVFRDNKTFQFALVLMTCFIIKNLHMIITASLIIMFLLIFEPINLLFTINPT